MSYLVCGSRVSIKCSVDSDRSTVISTFVSTTLLFTGVTVVLMT